MISLILLIIGNKEARAVKEFEDIASVSTNFIEATFTSCPAVEDDNVFVNGNKEASEDHSKDIEPFFVKQSNSKSSYGSVMEQPCPVSRIRSDKFSR